jgi:hypothetical protein
VKDKKTYYWCPNHNENKGMWVIHKPTDCKARKPDPNSGASLEQKAMQTIIDFAKDFPPDDDEDSEDSD